MEAGLRRAAASELASLAFRSALAIAATLTLAHLAGLSGR